VVVTDYGVRCPKRGINMFKIENRIMHGSSYALNLDNIEFLTWRLNEETKDYWVKLHLPSGKEIRIKVAEDDLRDIVDEVYQETLELDIGDEYGLDN